MPGRVGKKGNILNEESHYKRNSDLSKEKTCPETKDNPSFPDSL